MPTGKEGAAPVGARPQAGGGHLWEGKERWQGCDEGAAAARARPCAGIGHLTVREEGCRLAKRGQPRELATSGSVNSDAGLPAGNSPSESATADRNGPSLGE